MYMGMAPYPHQGVIGRKPYLFSKFSTHALGHPISLRLVGAMGAKNYIRNSSHSIVDA